MTHPEFIDILDLIDVEKEITIDEEKHNTELWNALLFAINKNRLDVVKYLINEGRINIRLALTNPEKREEEYDEEKFLEIDPEDELFGVEIALGNRSLDMFDFLWDANYKVWTNEHFKGLFNKLIELEWLEGLKSFMKSRVSHEIFISMDFDERREVIDHIASHIHDMEEEESDNEEGNDLKKYLEEAVADSPY
jgi:uncharacterized protein YuzE